MASIKVLLEHGASVHFKDYSVLKHAAVNSEIVVLNLLLAKVEDNTATSAVVSPFRFIVTEKIRKMLTFPHSSRGLKKGWSIASGRNVLASIPWSYYLRTVLEVTRSMQHS
jgi:hypothetical protein